MKATSMELDLRRGMVVWVELDPVQGREQGGRRPSLVVASNLYLRQADTLAIVVPATTRDRGWPNHVPLFGDLALDRPTYAMTEQPRTITRRRVVDIVGTVNPGVMKEVDMWLRDFLGLH